MFRPTARSLPEYAPDFDDSSWNTIKPKTDGDTGDTGFQNGRHDGDLPRARQADGGRFEQSGRADPLWRHVTTTAGYFVNNQRVGESHDWQAQPLFDIKKFLHAGDNVIAVGVKNDGGEGGLNPDVNVEIIGKPTASPWSRSLFNGLAQIIVQSTKDAGEIKLTASADGLQSATATIQTAAGTMRPSVP